jgi:hypothetical protein
LDQAVFDARHADALAQDRTLATSIRKRLREFYFPPANPHSHLAMRRITSIKRFSTRRSDLFGRPIGNLNEWT